MTSIYQSDKKISNERRLFQIALEALSMEGYAIERVPRAGKSSIRRITKDGKAQIATIRTTQDQWFAFPRTADGGWLSLDDADVVVVSALSDDKLSGWVHIMPAAEVRKHFDKAFEARRKANYSMPVGRGIWIGLYQEEDGETVRFVGSGLGKKYPRIAEIAVEASHVEETTEADQEPTAAVVADETLTIAEAKRRLALAFGVDPSSIKITIEA